MMISIDISNTIAARIVCWLFVWHAGWKTTVLSK